ncbi:hypothetical protein AVEN_51345-1 [Araneus ventricosus]|uniref:RNase H type-1 domain-containing protein n=1 Tax=Araneus ventricosus TaxID=182803 RepID=A0A4Y2L7B6_ARAVE|nr:hypothetical protein AVEN_51345-1 [Araneus ventricosus]
MRQSPGQVFRKTGPNYGVTANQYSKQSYHQNPRASIIQEIQMSLKDKPSFKVGWVKAHIGIAGNEAADELAKKALKECPKFEIPAPKRYLKNLLKTDSL